MTSNDKNMANQQNGDPIMTSINKSLQNPIVSGSIMPVDTVSTISNFSNASSVSNMSSVSNSSLYTIRQERRLDLYTYLREMSQTYLSELLYHFGLTCIISILASIIGTTVLYGWTLIISAFLIVAYSVFVSANITSIIRVWKSESAGGIDRYWAACMVLAYKNALILQEYIDVYEYQIKQDRTKMRGTKVEETEVHMIDDPNFQYIHPLEIKKILQRIQSYIRLAYELSTLTKSDNLSIQRNIVYCNVSDQSITNERNRRIESLLNVLEPQKKADIVDSWNAINKNICVRYQSMSFIPFRWMIYDYRNLFRYLNSAPELRKLYSSVGLNFESYERCVTDISQAMHYMRSEKSIYPSDLHEFTLRIGDMLGISADSLFGLSFVSSLANCTSVIGVISTGLCSLLLGGTLHLITISTIYTIQDLINKNRTENLSNKKMDLIMKEIKVICC